MGDVTALPTLYDEDEARKYLRMSKATLRRLRQRGLIGFVKLGDRKVYLTEQHLLDYLERKTVSPCLEDATTDSDKSATTGSRRTPRAPCGAAHGTTRRHDRHDVHHLAQKIFSRRK